MGREAYLARLAWGISAFQEPLRDENGDLALGSQARRYDNIDYVQQWDERGRPQNSTSVQNAKRFYRSQNEVLQACGLVVRKNAEKKRKRKGDGIPEKDQLDLLKEENETGFILRFVDSIAGDPLTWWVVNLKKRLLVFKPPRSSISEIFQAGLSSPNAMSFLFGGFAASALDSLIVAARDGDSEDTKYIDFLESRSQRPPVSWGTRLKAWGKWLLLLSIDMPLGMISTLQNLGFTIGPAVLAYLKSPPKDRTTSLSLRSNMPVVAGFASLVLIYIVRGRIYEELFWRSYVVLRQVLPRPQNPSKVSIQAAENDEFDESESIVGIGRSLGSHTDRRFYGPQSLWPALQVTFPWIGIFDKNKIDKDKIKQETLTRCAMMEDDDDYGTRPSRRNMTRRTENIISNLESLGIDLEEDFYVNVDQWSREIDHVEEQRAFDPAMFFESETTNLDHRNGQPSPTGANPSTRYRSSLTPPRIENSNSIIESADGSITVEFEIADHIRVEWEDGFHSTSLPTSPEDEVHPVAENPAEQSTINLLQSLEESNDRTEQTNSNEHITEPSIGAQNTTLNTASNEDVQHTPPTTASELGQPLTPEPGIRRATSLSHTQTTPRPIRRITETGDDGVEDYLAEVLAGARRLEAKKRIRDDRASRVTRVSVFASDSLAWHASTIITSLVLLPLNAIYYRRLTRWFLSLTEGLPTATSIFPREEMQLVENPFSWYQGRMILLSVGIECVLHGVVWSAGCGVARYYGRKYHWGKF